MSLRCSSLEFSNYYQELRELFPLEQNLPCISADSAYTHPNTITPEDIRKSLRLMLFCLQGCALVRIGFYLIGCFALEPVSTHPCISF